MSHTCATKQKLLHIVPVYGFQSFVMVGVGKVSQKWGFSVCGSMRRRWKAPTSNAFPLTKRALRLSTIASHGPKVHYLLISIRRRPSPGTNIDIQPCLNSSAAQRIFATCSPLTPINLAKNIGTLRIHLPDAEKAKNLLCQQTQYLTKLSD